jgi:thiol:disulfide interchange protein DsbD
MAWVLLALMLVAAGAAPSTAQTNPVYIHVTASLTPGDARAGEAALVHITAQITPPYHLYSLTQPSTADGFGPARTTLTLAPGTEFAQIGKPQQSKFETMFDKGFQIQDQIYNGTAEFGIPVALSKSASGTFNTTVAMHYQLCTDVNCLNATTLNVPLTIAVAPGPARPDHLAALSLANGAGTAPTTTTSTVASAAAQPAVTDATATKIAAAQRAGLLQFLLLAVGYGFLALLTPCVFPMIPITVSFFSKKRGQNSRQGLMEAIAYCAGIIGTFTVVGVAVAVVFKATGIRVLANNPWLNLGLAVLFVALGVNLMGGFEILLPPSLADKANRAAERTGLIGPFLMGLTFTITSFTCTVAFVGTLLAAAAKGNVFYPVMGMLAFSTAFALPFFLLALFPQYLNRLPRSGAWMVTVKGFMGFVEIAAAVKFLSNADLVWSLDILTRPVFLAIWFALATLAGLYLLGAIRLPHDESRAIGKARRVIGLLSLVAGIWFLAGINGTSLGQVVSFLPPQPYPGHADGSSSLLHWGHHYKAALAEAAADNHDVIINFTGVNCTNCRQMENTVFPLPTVQKQLARYTRVELYTDRDLPSDRANAALQQKLIHVATLPAYVVLSPSGQVLRVQQDRSTPSQFVKFLSQN